MDSSDDPIEIQLALAEAKGLPVKRKPGRPRLVRPAPSVDELAWARHENGRRMKYVDADRLVGTVAANRPSGEIVWSILAELAIESAAIRFEIISSQAAGRADSIAKYTSRRIDALTKMAAIILEMRKIGVVDINPYSSAVQHVFELFVDKVRRAATETMPNAEAFMRTIGAALAGWEERCR